MIATDYNSRYIYVRTKFESIAKAHLVISLRLENYKAMPTNPRLDTLIEDSLHAIPSVFADYYPEDLSYK